MNGFLAVAVGGALGASLRYGVGLLSARYLPAGWPWGTLTVNILGCFVMGVLAAWLSNRDADSSENLRLLLATGILGGFTTFSAFSLETLEFLRTGETGKATLYALLSVILSVGALALGLFVARRGLV